jgi:Holliday junction resolvase RusA-like endonuclease
MSKRQRARILAGEEVYLGRIDVDNASKACLDAMNGVCFGDDKQIVRLLATKIPSDEPGVDVRIEALSGISA